MPQSPVSLNMFRVVAYRLPVRVATGTSFGQPRVWGSNLFYLFKHVGQYNGPSPKPRSQFAAITGNPAGLLFWRIWYSVGKSGVLGITEYRQGRPLPCIFILQYLQFSIFRKNNTSGTTWALNALITVMQINY